MQPTTPINYETDLTEPNSTQPRPKRRVLIEQTNQVTVAGHLIEISGNALRKYRERFHREDLSYTDARNELQRRLRREGTISREKPLFLRGRPEYMAAFASLDDGDLVLPLRPHRDDDRVMVAVTCLYR